MMIVIVSTEYGVWSMKVWTPWKDGNTEHGMKVGDCVDV